MSILEFDIDRDRRDLDVASEIAQLVPDDSGFTVMLMKAKKRRVNSSEIIWFEDQPRAAWTQATGAQLVGDTNLIVDDSSVFQEKDVMKNCRTGEVMYVTAVPDATHVTVVRGYGVTVAAAMNDNDWLLRLGNAMEENSNAPASVNGQPTKFNNYVQTFRTPFDASMITTKADKKTSQNERQRMRAKKALEHRLDLERALLFGEKKEDVANKRRMMGGIDSRITTNVYDAGGTMTEAEFENFCEMLFAYGSKTKLLVASARVITVINQFAASKLRTVVGAETYGVSTTQYISAHGKLYIVPSRTLENTYANQAYGVDMDNIEFNPFADEDTTLRPNIQANDVHGWKDEYLTSCTCTVKQEKTHAKLTNVTG